MIEILSLAQEKNLLRRKLLYRRSEISHNDRQQAAKEMMKTLSPILDPFPKVLSFASFGTEINTQLLNKQLAKQGKLLLPFVAGETLHIFHVKEMDKQLEKNSWGIEEPIPHLCEEVNYEDITFSLAPGIAFDPFNNRLGYGKGYYDRLLAKMPHCQAIGIGFKSQLFTPSLPITERDIPLTGTLLF